MSRISFTVSGKTGSAWPAPHQLISGMMTNADSAPPATITEAMRMPRIHPTPISAGDTEMAKLALNGSARWNLPPMTLRPSVTSLNNIPTPMPQNTGSACLPPASAATSTSAHAIPSGYGRRPCSSRMR